MICFVLRVCTTTYEGGMAMVEEGKLF